MAKLDIIVAGNPVLRLKAKEVERIDKNSPFAERYGGNHVRGRRRRPGSASGRCFQTNSSYRRWRRPDRAYQSGYHQREGSVVGGEGCLSVPNFEGEVERAEYIECEFLTVKANV